MTKWIFSILLLMVLSTVQAQQEVDPYGAIVRSDISQKTIYLCFTGHDYFEGFEHVLKVLDEARIKGSFFLTGDFVRIHPKLVSEIADAGHFVGAHSDKHLLYNDWEKRDSLLILPNKIQKDILDNVKALEALGIYPKVFMPPYEWYNRKVVEIAKGVGQLTVNFTSGTRSNADYTTPDMKNYISSLDIITSIFDFESNHGMNGFHLLIHPGTDPKREDKLYTQLESLILELKQRGYGFDRF
jgi:peptidoglycan/xylan/chitin deacetylase (PgdA/CDA1 family)